MNQIARIGLILFITLIALVMAAGYFHYHLRLRAVIGEPVVLEFDKDTWVGCLPEATMSGRIERVELDGVVVTDTSGAFQRANGVQQLRPGKLACPGFDLMLLDEKSKQYFVPFHSLAGMRNGKQWHWSNPFPA